MTVPRELLSAPEIHDPRHLLRVPSSLQRASQRQYYLEAAPNGAPPARASTCMRYRYAAMTVRIEHGRVLQAYLREKGERLVYKAHRAVESIKEHMLARLDRDKIRWLLRR